MTYNRMEERLLRSTMTHTFGWVEIPSNDFDRAVDFYSSALDEEIEVHEHEEGGITHRMGMFSAEEDDVSGMIVGNDEYTTDSGETIAYTPTADSGVIVYLNVEDDLDDVLSRVESAGGEILIPAEPIPETDGYYALITDSERNRIGLMSTE